MGNRKTFIDIISLRRSRRGDYLIDPHFENLRKNQRNLSARGLVSDP
jgi:hypothetical protein